MNSWNNGKRQEVDKKVEIQLQQPPQSYSQYFQQTGPLQTGDAAAWPVQGLIRHFRGEIERRIDEYSANPHSDPVLVAAE
jgi:NADH:ubiquinone oxidoreductase subunit F (NADH-binding)